MTRCRCKAAFPYAASVSAIVILAGIALCPESRGEEGEARLRSAVSRLGTRSGLTIRSLNMDAGISGLASPDILRVVAHGKAAVPLLTQLVLKDQGSPAVDAVIALGLLGRTAESAAPVLRALAQSAESRLCGLSLLALVSIVENPEQLLPTAREQLNAGNPSRYSIWAVGSMGTNGKTFVPLLTDFVRDGKQPNATLWALERSARQRPTPFRPSYAAMINCLSRLRRSRLVASGPTEVLRSLSPYSGDLHTQPTVG